MTELPPLLLQQHSPHKPGEHRAPQYPLIGLTFTSTISSFANPTHSFSSITDSSTSTPNRPKVNNACLDLHHRRPPHVVPS
eukprot:g7364.t1 g7364   contig24:440737-441090(+)